MRLRERWDIVHKYSRQLDILIIAVIVVAVAYYAYRHVKRRRKEKLTAKV